MLWVCTTKEFLQNLSETISGKLNSLLVILTKVLTWLLLSRWRSVLIHKLIPVSNCTGQMADIVYVVMCVRGLLMSTL